jgi:hypothetical protein
MQLRLTLFLLLFCNIAIAKNDNPLNFSVVPSANNIYNVYYKCQDGEKVKISIVNSNNMVVFSERIRVGSFKRPYNFTNLAYGEYSIIIEDNIGKQVQKINHNSKKIKSSISVTEVTGEANKYALKIVNNGTQLVTVRIYDNVTGLIHTQNVKVTGYYGLIYNLAKVKSSENSIIMFEISADGNVQTLMF